MNLYAINEAIYSLVDPETGEILDYEAFTALQMERDEKLENTALWYKDLMAEAAALKAEKDILAERERKCKEKAESLKKFLALALEGSKFKTARVACSFTTSTKVEIKDEAAFIEAMEKNNHIEFLRYKAPEVNRTAITEAIKAGLTVDGAELVKNKSIIIK